MSKTAFTVSLGAIQKQQIDSYFKLKRKKSPFIINLVLKAIALNKTDVIKVPATGKSTNLFITCTIEQKQAIDKFVSKHKLNKSQWIVGLIYEAML